MKKRSSKLVTAADLALGLTASASTPASAALLTNPSIIAGSPAFGQVVHNAGAFTSANVFDADQNAFYNTEYASNGQGVNTFLTFNFLAQTKIAGMSFVNRSSNDGITASSLTFSTDATFGNGDDIVVALSHLAQPGNQSNEFRFDPVTAQYVRWDVNGISGIAPNQGARYIRFIDDTEPGRYTMTHIATSGNFAGGTFDAVHAYDGRTDTEWASNGQGVNTQIDFDLGTGERVGGFVYVQRLSGVDSVASANLIFATDAAFTNVVATRAVSLNTGASARTAVEFNPVAGARYVRFDVTAIAGGSPNVGVSNMYFVPNELTPVAATASTTFSGAQTVANLINDSGLAGRGIGALHDNAGGAATMWHSSGGVVNNEWLLFDLGALYDLDAAVVWNMNQSGLTGRGVKQMEIFASANNITFTSLGLFDLDAATGAVGEPGQWLTLNVGYAEYRYLRFDINTAISGNLSEFVGLSEVRFVGVLAPAPAALPAGLALLGAMTLRRRVR